MDWGDVSWIVAAAVLLAVAGYLWRLWRAAVRRRERQLHYLRTKQASRPQRLSRSGKPTALTGMTPDDAALVRASAERTARHDWVAGERAEANPHRNGTPEAVLWTATYHLTLAELDDAPGAHPEQGASPR